jgi:hypothetical protein
MKRSPIPVREVVVFDPLTPATPCVQGATGLLIVDSLADMVSYALDLVAVPTGLEPGRRYSAHLRAPEGEQLELAGLICLTSGRDPIFTGVRPRVDELAAEAG